MTHLNWVEEWGVRRKTFNYDVVKLRWNLSIDMRTCVIIDEEHLIFSWKHMHCSSACLVGSVSELQKNLILPVRILPEIKRLLSLYLQMTKFFDNSIKINEPRRIPMVIASPTIRRDELYAPGTKITDQKIKLYDHILKLNAH